MTTTHKSRLLSVAAVMAAVFSMALGHTQVRAEGVLPPRTSGLGSLAVKPSVAPAPATQRFDGDVEGFVHMVGEDVNRYWAQEFAKQDMNYRPPTLVVWTSHKPIPIVSADGQVHLQDPAGGPFYANDAETVVFPVPELWEAMLPHSLREFGDFAVAAIIAHEYGHHVQNIGGIRDVYREQMYESEHDEVAQNHLSQRYELQADCYAGTWSNWAHYQSRLEPGDLDEALNVTMSVGDDNLGVSHHEEWTHGDANLRRGWFYLGYRTGNLANCNTWGDADLTSQPTLTALLEKTFTAITPNACGVADDSFDETIMTVRCGFGGVQADYDYHTSWQGMHAFIEDIAHGATGLTKSTWRLQGDNDSESRGTLWQFINSHGHAVIVWTFDYALMAGSASRDDDNQELLYAWWRDNGGNIR